VSPDPVALTLFITIKVYPINLAKHHVLGCPAARGRAARRRKSRREYR
jgi:hypothetical protein